MQQNRFRLAPLTAAALINGIYKGVKLFSPKSMLQGFSITTQVGGFNLAPRPILLEQLESEGYYKNILEQLINTPFLNPISLNFQTELFTLTLEYDSFQPVLVVDWKSLDVANRIRLADGLSELLNLNRKNIKEGWHLPSQEEEIFAHGRALVEDLSAQVTKLSFTSIETLQKLEVTYLEKAASLEKSFQEKSAGLEAEHVKKHQELDKSIEIHRQEKAKFDARENTVVRRELLGKITEIIERQKEMKVSGATEGKRRIIHCTCAFSIMVAVAIMSCFGYKLTTGTVDWHLWLPFTSGVIMFASTVVYYIRWNDNWFRSHAEAEFANRKFNADMLRASWLAELYFEWDSKKDREMPEYLIQSFSRDLFTEVTSTRTQHPFDDLNELLKKVSSVKLNKSGIELTKDKAAVR